MRKEKQTQNINSKLAILKGSQSTGNFGLCPTILTGWLLGCVQELERCLRSGLWGLGGTAFSASGRGLCPIHASLPVRVAAGFPIHASFSRYFSGVSCYFVEFFSQNFMILLRIGYRLRNKVWCYLFLLPFLVVCLLICGTLCVDGGELGVDVLRDFVGFSTCTTRLIYYGSIVRFMHVGFCPCRMIGWLCPFEGHITESFYSVLEAPPSETAVTRLLAWAGPATRGEQHAWHVMRMWLSLGSRLTVNCWSVDCRPMAFRRNGI